VFNPSISIKQLHFILTELEPSWSYGIWIYNYLCNHCLSPLKLWVWTPFINDGSKVCVCSALKMRSVMCTSYCLHDWQTIFIILLSHVMQLIRIYTTEEYFYFPHLVVWGRYCACEILIANTIDWLFAACLEYFIFFSMVETSHHLISIRLYFILTILITEDDYNHIVFDWIKIIAV
jgi:hypothetical protein